MNDRDISLLLAIAQVAISLLPYLIALIVIVTALIIGIQEEIEYHMVKGNR